MKLFLYSAAPKPPSPQTWAITTWLAVSPSVTVTVKFFVTDAGVDALSVTLAVRWYVPTEPVMPVMTPLELTLRLEADRMARLVLREPQVKSEKEVVANERRQR